MTSEPKKQWKIQINFEIKAIGLNPGIKELSVYLDPHPVHNVIAHSLYVNKSGEFTPNGICKIYEYFLESLKLLFKNDSSYSYLNLTNTSNKINVEAIKCARLVLVDVNIKEKYLTENPYYGPKSKPNLSNLNQCPTVSTKLSKTRGWAWCPNITNPYHYCSDYCVTKYKPKSKKKNMKLCKYGNKCRFKNTTCKFRHP